MTTAQRSILDHMNQKNIGSFYFDLGRRWIWKSTVREDAGLAEEIVAFMPATFKK